ncbi:MAG: hypothetical protein AB7G75_20220 [Candidatus Binatia bacterium]
MTNGLPVTVEAGADCKATVTLDGSGSYDPDAAVGDFITSYTWAGPFGTASGPNPVVAFALQPIGENTYTLTAEDTHGATGVDTVVVTVAPPPSPDVQQCKSRKCGPGEVQPRAR